ncbi:somatostatin receptor type 5-like [Rhinoderma darwinii]|uniref:somatostatin receptor type 5-like n=1 Tax=Rhinoderma darwinii TaxID=43563 RepID=UPI003F660CE7
MEDEIEANTSFHSENLYLFEEDFNSTDYSDPPLAMSVTFISFLLVCLVGLLGNALVLFIILWFKKMWRTTNVFVFSLALGDFFYMLCLLFLAIEQMHSLGTFMCKLYWTLTSLTTFSSVYFLAIMSIDVFLQMYFPSFSKKLRLKGAALSSLVIWILSLLLGIPFFLYANVDEFSNCRISWPEPAAVWNISFISYRFSIAFLAPVILIGVFLTLTQCRVRRHDQSTLNGVKEDVVMIMVLSLVFIVFWLPTHFLEIVSGAIPDLEFSEECYYLILIIPYLKSCIYPFLYGCLSSSFKDLFDRIFCCKKVQEDPKSQ